MISDPMTRKASNFALFCATDFCPFSPLAKASKPIGKLDISRSRNRLLKTFKFMAGIDDFRVQWPEKHQIPLCSSDWIFISFCISEKQVFPLENLTFHDREIVSWKRCKFIAEFDTFWAKSSGWSQFSLAPSGRIFVNFRTSKKQVSPLQNLTFH